MKLTRLTKDSPEAPVIKLIFKEAQKHPLDGQWREYDEMLHVLGKTYHVKCMYVIKNNVFSYKNLIVKTVEKKSILIN